MSGGGSSSLEELFRAEARAQVALLTEELIGLEDGATPARLEALMRAAHSLKGAARIVGHDQVVRVAHSMEDCFVAAQDGRLRLRPEHVDVLLRAVDLLGSAAAMPLEESAAWRVVHAGEVDAVVGRLEAILAGASADIAPPPSEESAPPPPPPAATPPTLAEAMPDAAPEAGGRNEQLLTHAGEAIVAAGLLARRAADVARARRAQHELARSVEDLRATLERRGLLAGGDPVAGAMAAVQRAAAASTALERERETALELVARRVSRGAGQLYEEVLAARMRPFASGTAAFPRVVRDLARELGREARLVVEGEATPVDRDVLRRLDGPLGHLLRNAVDHGIEPPAERVTTGKPARGTIRLAARHAGGRLLVTVEDDGRGVDIGRLRHRVVERGLADEPAAAAMSGEELLQFLFLPGFSLRDEVTALSGRGVGLDAVQTAVREIGGHVRVASSTGGDGRPAGTRFELQLPLTLSVVRALVAEIDGEAYALPLARVTRALRVPRERIESVEGRQHFAMDGRQVGLLWAHQILGLAEPVLGDDAAVVVVGEHETLFGIVVDGFLGERELVLRGLDARLGKVPNVGGASLLPDGSPVLVLDVDDIVQTAAGLAAGGRLDPLRRGAGAAAGVRKRVLVVDDSLTVRELERKMIETRGYHVDVAVDGMDGWNAVRGGHYDLVVTDVDMPRMDGIELVTLIRNDAALRGTPVMIVSYKDRDEDRRRGLDAGADHYLTKGSFYDETMLRAIEDLIGAASG